jgi:hypothetical protein
MRQARLWRLGLTNDVGGGEVSDGGCVAILDVGDEIPVAGDDGGVALQL